MAHGIRDARLAVHDVCVVLPARWAQTDGTALTSVHTAGSAVDVPLCILRVTKRLTRPPQ